MKNLMKNFISIQNEFISTFLLITKGKTTRDVPKPRPMKFPYTLTAKAVQFPWLYYYKESWVFRYYFIALLVSLPIFWKLQRLSNSEGNKKKAEEAKHRIHERYEAAIRERHAQGIYNP